MSCIFPISQIEDNDPDDFYTGNSLSDHISLSIPYNIPSLPKGLKIIHLNVNGLYSKIDQLQYLLNDLGADICLIAETHLNLDEDYPGLDIPGYRFVRQDRERFWGGLLVFYKEQLSITVLDTPPFTYETESLALVLKLPFSSPFLISCIYRRPDSKNLACFFPELNLFLSKISDYSSIYKESYIFGDFNIDLLVKSSIGQKLIGGLQEYGYCQLITEPTHHTKNSHTLIDHIYSNSVEFSLLVSLIMILFI